MSRRAGKRVVIIGGGLAGLSTAITLGEEGYEVTLLERKPFLGGRTFSCPVPAKFHASSTKLDTLETSNNNSTQELMDNCQHVLMRCCTNLVDLCKRLNVENQISYYQHYCFLDAQGNFVTLHGSCLPAPLHMLPSFIRFSPLKFKDKLAIIFAFSQMLRQEKQIEKLDQISMLDWLKKHHQSAKAIENFWRVILVSALNEELERISARYGLKVFLDGLLKSSFGFQLGIPKLPLSKLFAEPAGKLIEKYNGKILLRNNVIKIEASPTQVEKIILQDQSKLEADYFICCIPPTNLLSMLPPEIINTNKYFSELRQFATSPIVSIYLWFDREICTKPNIAFLEKEIHWLFTKEKNFVGADRPVNHYIALVISAAQKYLKMSNEQILEIVLKELHEVIPQSSSAQVIDSVIIKDQQATFSCRPGCDSSRPNQKSPLENLYIAGDWTNTGWPATMESAVISGYKCTEYILKEKGLSKSLVQPDLPTTGLSKWLCKKN